MPQAKFRRFALAATVLAFSVIAGAQTPSAAPTTSTPKWSYDVVSIKPNNSGDHRMSIDINGSEISTENARVVDIVAQAYGIKTELIFGLPKWADGVRYDIAAKMTPEDAAALKKLSRDDSRAANQAMTQAMLAERYKLKAHIETKELPVYELVVAKNGPKLKAAIAPDNSSPPNGPDGAPRRAGSMRMTMDKLEGQGVQIGGMLGLLSNQVHRPVIDKTGLTGTYDFTLKFAMDRENMPMMPPGLSLPPASADDPSIFAALEDQLGLKLVSSKGLVDTLVIDHIEQPTAN